MRAGWIGLAALLFGGCAVVNYLPGEEPIHLVIRGGAPFWTYGPQQAGMPDENLDLGDPVKVIRFEYGFSRVQLESGLTGYVANEDLEKAPLGTVWNGAMNAAPEVLRPRGNVAAVEGEQVEVESTRSKPKREREVYRGPIVDDEPLPVEEPDFDVTPSDAPVM